MTSCIDPDEDPFWFADAALDRGEEVEVHVDGFGWVDYRALVFDREDPDHFRWQAGDWFVVGRKDALKVFRSRI